MARSDSPSSTSGHNVKAVDVGGFTKNVDDAASCLHGGQAPLPGDPLTAKDPKAWRAHAPDVNRACADAMEEGEKVLEAGGLKFNFQDMRDNERRHENLLKVRSRAEEVIAVVDVEIDVCRGRMLHHTDQVLTLAQTRIDDPTRDAAFRERVRRLFSRPFEIRDEVNVTIADKRRANRTNRAEFAALEQTVSRAGLEVRALRGDKLTVDDVQPPAAPKTARRPRKHRR